MRVNLLQTNEKTLFNINWQHIFIIVIICLIIFSMFLDFYNLHTRKSFLRNEIARTDDSITLYQNRMDEFRQLEKSINRLEEKLRVDYKRYFLSAGLEDLLYIIPEELTLTSVNIDNGLVQFNGYSASNDELVALLDQLTESDAFLNPVFYKLERENVIYFQIQVGLKEKDD